MVDKKEDKGPGKNPGPESLPKTKVINPGEKQKSVVLTTDGKTVNVDANNVSMLEVEMMLIKALNLVRKGE